MNKVPLNTITLSVVIEKDKDGYVAECRELQGFYTQGSSYEEALENIKEAIELHLEDRAKRGDVPIELLSGDHVSLTTLSFPVPSRK